MKRLLTAAALLITAAMLCGCDKNRDPEETDIIETTVLDTIIETVTSEQNETEPLLIAESQSWGNAVYVLELYGEHTGTNNYSGTLLLSKYSTDDQNNAVDRLCSCTVYENEDFSVYPPENGALSYQGSYLIFENDVPADNGETRKQYRFFCSDDNGIFEFRQEEYEKHPELLGDRGRALILENPVFSSNGEAADFGTDRYIEFDYNIEHQSMAVSGWIDFIPMDDELLADAREGDYRDGLVYADIANFDFVDSFEKIGNDEEREETYYRIPADIAVNSDGLYDYYSDYFTEKYIGTDRNGFYENFFGRNFPYVMEDEYGLIMVAAYRGVYSSFDFDTARLAEITDNSAKLFVRGWSLDGEIIAERDYVRSGGNWKLDEHQESMVNSFWALEKQAYLNGWTQLDCDFDSFDIRVGETRRAEVSIFSNNNDTTMMCDANGVPYVVCIEKAEDFDGFDLSSLDINSGIVYCGGTDPENGEPVDTPEIQPYEYTFAEAGEYVIWAGWRCASKDGEIKDTAAGPKRFSVK